MSKNINGIPVIFEEEPNECSTCHKFEECRPYGKNGALVCFDCAMKDKETTKEQMNMRLFGEPPTQ